MNKRITILIVLAGSFLLAFSEKMDNQPDISSTLISKDFYEEIDTDYSIQNKPIIEITIQGIKKRFLIDTKSPTAISANLLEHVNYTFYDSILTGDYNNIFRKKELVRIPQIEISTIILQDIIAVVVDENFLKEHNISGLIGGNILRHFIIRFNLKKEKTIITDNFKHLEISKGSSLGDIQLIGIQTSPILSMVLSENISEEVAFDCASGTLYDMSSHSFFQIYNHVDIKDNIISKSKGILTFGIYGSEKDTTHYLLRLPNATLGEYKLNNLRSYTIVGRISILGAGLFRHGQVTIDYINKHFYFTPYKKSSKQINCYQKLPGFKMVLYKDNWVISNVWESSPAYHAGIRKGMIVYKINSKEIKGLTTLQYPIKTFKKRKESIVLTILEKDNQFRSVKFYTY